LNSDGDHPAAVALWHAIQLVLPVGMCVPDLPGAVVPLWQLLQFVAVVYRLWSGLLAVHAEVDLWHPSQTVTPLWTAVLGFCVAPRDPLLWQVAHEVLTEKFLWKVPGFHDV
jgi:hypothetical protein